MGQRCRVCWDSDELSYTVIPHLLHHEGYPKLDKLIDDKDMGKMRAMTRDLVTTVFNDYLVNQVVTTFTVTWTIGNRGIFT